jgi:hypothetical protein
MCRLAIQSWLTTEHDLSESQNIMRRIPFLTFLVVSVLSTQLSAQAPWGPAPGSAPAYSVVYTGRLFGYFRYPDEQSTRDSGCPVVDDSVVSPQVREFRSTLEQIRRQSASASILVSLGDNFAPEFLARAMRNQNSTGPYSGQMLLKDAFTADPTGEHWESDGGGGPSTSRQTLMHGKVPSDNVACFMRLANINAVVPGQHDFYFGPDRVRQLARFLAQPPSSVYKPVQMLAANLSIVSSAHHPASPASIDRLRPAVRNALKSSTSIRIDLPAAVMPWLQTVSVISPDAASVYDCPANPTNPRDFSLPFEPDNACSRLVPDERARNAYTLARPSRLSPDSLSYYTLDPGSNHALCTAYEDKGQREVSCQLFSVQYPFFQYGPNSSGTTPAPYVLVEPPTGSHSPAIAIFGVLDPALIGYIGEFNSTYLNANREFDTRLQITDPVEALRQIVGLCEADQSCRSARKVLLAQMPLYKAMQLANKIAGFDLVLTQADSDHAGQDENRSRLISATSAPYVLSPGLSFDPSRDAALNVNLRKADFYFETHAAGGQSWQYLATRSYATPVSPLRQPDRDVEALETAAAQAVGEAPRRAVETATHNYETLALASLQRFCGSDVALLQHRDIFGSFAKAIAYWPPNRNYDRQALLDEVLWKGDFGFCLPVKGSTLKKMLQDSAGFDREDQDYLSLALERGRGLSTLGITDPSSNQPIIAGQPIDDNRLYGVAMTDYLAFGDTGYPELSAEAVLPRVRVTSLGRLHRVAGLACERLIGAVPGGCAESEPIESSRYFDNITLKAFDVSPGLNAAQQLQRWLTSPLHPQPIPATLFSPGQQTAESQVERRGTWWFTLQNLSAEYDLAFLRGSDHTIPANFSGINTFAQLSTPESSRIGIWTRVRGGYLFPRFFDFYASGEERYSYSATRISTTNGNFGAYQPALSDNLVRAEVGLLSKPVSRTIPLRFLLSENLFTQVTSPLLVLAVPIPCTSSGCIPGATTIKAYDLGKNYQVTTRVGARLQGRGNWFEAGREYGENIDIPVGYMLQDVGRSQPFSCAIAGNLSVSQCIASDPLFTSASKVLPDLHNQPISGWFLNFHTAVPLYESKLQLTFDSYGEVFDKRAGDTTFNTRYYENLTSALKVPLWGNLTFAPQVELFLFQSKVVPGQALMTNHYTFVTSSVTLEYNFDWHRGVGLRRALQYPGGVSTSPSPGIP